MNAPDKYQQAREIMHDRHIVARGIIDETVIRAMSNVPREKFVPRKLRESAYADSPQPIGFGQTISQPYIVALMCEALRLHGDERVLEIGTGSGYAAAVLCQLCHEVFTVECIEALAHRATRTLHELDYSNVHVLAGDGTMGWPDEAPFDAIVVTAGGPSVPDALKAQLTIGGRLVIPVGDNRNVQQLLRVTRINKDKFTTEDLAAVRFVPLIGEQGWQHGTANQ